MDELKTKWDEAKAQMTDIFDRMDTDRKLVDLEKYVLTDVADKKIPNAISVTLSDAATFAWNVEAALGTASEQVVVESEDKKLDTAYIEDFIRSYWSTANARRIMAGEWPIDAFLDQQACRRGRQAVRCFTKINAKTMELTPDIVPWDTRFVCRQRSADGLVWAGYETERTSAMVLADYPDAEVKTTASGKASDSRTIANNTVLDIWQADTNTVQVNGKDVVSQKNPFGSVPVVYQMVPLGSMLADADTFKHHGESIFFLIRDLIPELNRLVSIIQSINQKALDNALIYKNVLGTEGPEIGADKATAPGATTRIGVSESLGPIEFGEIKRSAYLLHQIIELRIQRGSLSNFEYGTFTQPMSAVALVEIGEGRDQVFLPRLGTRGLTKQQVAEMAIDQTLQLAKVHGVRSVQLGPRGHKRTFEVSKLEGEYTIQYKYFIKSPKVDIARYQMATSAGNMISNWRKRREILQMEDPEEEERMLRWEEAERLSPAIKVNRVVKNLLEEADRGNKDAEFEAELLSAQMGINLEQLLQGEVQLPQPQQEQKPEPLIPLTAQGRISSQKRAAQLQAEPEGEE